MKKPNLTLQDIIDFAEKNNLPKTVRIGIFLADSGRGDLGGGVIASTVEAQEVTEDGESHEIDGHIYCGHMDGEFYEMAEEDVIVITDGYHYE